jgi:hypothetical protein
MKHLLIAIATLLGALTTTFAQQTCTPPQNTVIFYGNGINTAPDKARDSLDLLQTGLGDTYNGQTLSYDLAYNETE